MKTRTAVPLLIGLMATLLAFGCAKNFVITTELSGPLQVPIQFRIGSVTDQLPSTVEIKDKPSAEDIEKFKRYIAEELDKTRLDFRVSEEGVAAYEIVGGIMQYAQGSGVARFFIGFGTGTARVVVELKLVKMADGEVVFAGNFEGKVTHWAQSGDEMFKLIARDFAKQIEKQHEMRTKQG